MDLNSLFIFVEGNDDERFFNRIVIPRLESKYSTIHIVKYSRLSADKISSYIRSIKAMGSDYIFVSDINNYPCISKKKKHICKNCREIEHDNIVIVVKEIESWYIAGLDEHISKKLRIKNVNCTDNITKEQFNSMIPDRYSRIGFMIEILRNYSLDIAIRKNASFRYFAEKYLH